MAEAYNLQRLRNPWALQLQKLGLELKCPTWYCKILSQIVKKFRVTFLHFNGFFSAFRAEKLYSEFSLAY